MITIKEIAELADLSIGTVDRVLHGRGRVSKATEAKIRTIIKNTGYQGNVHARNLSRNAAFAFGVIIPYSERDSDYWEMLQNGIDRAIREFSTFKISRRFFFFDRYSETSFKNACSDALHQGMAGYIIAPVHTEACRGFVAEIPEETPYVFVDSMVPGTAPLAYIGQDSYQSGVCGGRLMQLALGGAGKVAVVRMLPNDPHIENRVRGFTSFFHNSSSVHVREFSVNGGCADHEFVAQIRTIEREYPDCNGYFVTNAAAYRLVRALQACGINGVKVIGYDCTEENCRLLKEGYIAFIISQRTAQQGYLAIDALYRTLVLASTPARQVHMPIDIIIAENISCYS